jgi:hypothetical protein
MATIASISGFTAADAPTGASIWRRLLDRVLEGRRRKADLVIARYLRECHPDSPLRVELERRMKGQ